MIHRVEWWDVKSKSNNNNTKVSFYVRCIDDCNRVLYPFLLSFFVVFLYPSIGRVPATFWLVAVLFEEIERFGLHLEEQAIIGRLDSLDGLNVYHWDDEDMCLCCGLDVVECQYVLVLFVIELESVL